MPVRAEINLKSRKPGKTAAPSPRRGAAPARPARSERPAGPGRSVDDAPRRDTGALRAAAPAVRAEGRPGRKPAAGAAASPVRPDRRPTKAGASDRQTPAASARARPARPARSVPGATRTAPSRPKPDLPAEAAPSQVRHVTVGAYEDGQRIDNFLLKRLPGVPKSHVYQLLRSGQVRVGGGRAKAERKLVAGEEVRIPPVRVAERGEPVRAPDAVLNRLREAIVFEDEHYLAICKPAGLASHGGTGIAYGVIEAARGWGRHEFLELAHRLDRDTSGVLLLAKTRPALLRAQRAFREGLADKRYFALLLGRLQGGARDVDAALVKSRLAGGERYVEIDEEDGKPSKSRFVPQAHYRDATLCEVHIFSGRTHQIRVHSLALGHPVAGDRKYGLRDEQKPLRDRGLRRMFLHSHFLQLPADGAFPKLIINAPMTEELREFLDLLGPGR